MNYTETIELEVRRKLRERGMKDTPENRDEVLEELRQYTRTSVIFEQDYRRALTREIHRNYAEIDF